MLIQSLTSTKLLRAFFTFILIAGLGSTAQAQLSTKLGEGKLFGRAYTQFYYAFDDAVRPKSAFNVRAGIIGYEYTLNPKISIGIMYDVTRTTNFKYTDSSGVSGYFEGSKYTAYLKMCQIKWNFRPGFSLLVGQLLSAQYLLTQDKWWGMRFLDVTAQERFSFGMPADFGMALIYQPKNNMKFTASILNGEGPFRYQDDDANYLYLLKAEYAPKEGIQLMGYVDYETVTPGLLKADKMNLLVFAGYKIKPWMIGIEAVYAQNASFIENYNRKLLSIFASYQLNQSFSLLGRVDYGNLNSSKETYYLIGGVQYTLDSNYFVSLNYRQDNYLVNSNVPYIYFNVGLHF